MEKGFNDDELADIMNEIESLEKEFSHDEEIETVETHSAEHEVTAAAATDDQHEPQAHQPEHEETMAAHEEEEARTVEESVAHSEPVSSPVGKEVQDEMGEVLGDLANMPVEDVAPSAVHDHGHCEEENVHHLKHTASQNQERKAPVSGGHTAMSFHVEGEMKFELSFHIGGKFVGLTVTEEGLEIGLDGGAKFTVPIEEAERAKKAS